LLGTRAFTERESLCILVATEYVLERAHHPFTQLQNHGFKTLN